MIVPSYVATAVQLGIPVHIDEAKQMVQMQTFTGWESWLTPSMSNEGDTMQDGG